jgi:molecular chaperone GrpE (heat shock protein)
LKDQIRRRSFVRLVKKINPFLFGLLAAIAVISTVFFLGAPLWFVALMGVCSGAGVSSFLRYRAQKKENTVLPEQGREKGEELRPTLASRKPPEPVVMAAVGEAISERIRIINSAFSEQGSVLLNTECLNNLVQLTEMSKASEKTTNGTEQWMTDRQLKILRQHLALKSLADSRHLITDRVDTEQLSLIAEIPTLRAHMQDIIGVYQHICTGQVDMEPLACAQAIKKMLHIMVLADSVRGIFSIAEEHKDILESYRASLSIIELKKMVTEEETLREQNAKAETRAIEGKIQRFRAALDRMKQTQEEELQAQRDLVAVKETLVKDIMPFLQNMNAKVKGPASLVDPDKHDLVQKRLQQMREWIADKERSVKELEDALTLFKLERHPRIFFEKPGEAYSVPEAETRFAEAVEALREFQDKTGSKKATPPV